MIGIGGHKFGDDDPGVVICHNCGLRVTDVEFAHWIRWDNVRGIGEPHVFPTCQGDRR